MFYKNCLIFNTLALLPSIALAGELHLPTTPSITGDIHNMPNMSDKKQSRCDPTTTGDRYTDNGDGTVTDNRTCRIWLKETDCLGKQTWVDAKVQICLLNGRKDCGRVSKHGHKRDSQLNCEGYTMMTFTDWQLPTLQELQSVIDYNFFNPALSDVKGANKWGKVPKNDAFSSVRLDLYWSATTNALGASHAWHIRLTDGNTGSSDKERARNYVWPVLRFSD
jgi:hypothetical protein